MCVMNFAKAENKIEHFILWLTPEPTRIHSSWSNVAFVYYSHEKLNNKTILPNKGNLALFCFAQNEVK